MNEIEDETVSRTIVRNHKTEQSKSSRFNLHFKNFKATLQSFVLLDFLFEEKYNTIHLIY